MLENNQNLPYYNIDDFINDCANKKIIVFKKAQEDAKTFFNISTQADLLHFIAYGGCEKLHFISSKLWDKNPDKNNPTMVDGYEFTTNNKNGYIAFMKSKQTGLWIIKSFHEAYSISINDLLYKPFSGLDLED
ncbi:hypothetical protein [Treponema phagedenis]|uniref:hypothetical protein n=1 Tax=Treponema phagedenis TaxID=162 RepID=UPI0001F63B20|nr:hypothetical protein [Treponema phagedenis]EFW38673.1 hypothetical protein HMPREF9554_00850 [Treponema phagedenis F0421]TYT79731.1 hypothetical protein FS559_11980 [Treponema phagedenis]